MTDRAVILIIGSRALDDTERAREWAFKTILQWVMDMPPGADALSGGCAESPDEWARKIVLGERPDMTFTEFRLDGHKWINGEKTDATWIDLAPPGAERDRGTTRWPLRRNDALAQAMLRAFVRRWYSFSWSVALRAPCPLEFAPPDKLARVRARLASGEGRW